MARGGERRMPGIGRREAIGAGLAATFCGMTPLGRSEASPSPARKFLTPAGSFQDVSRGKPIPHALRGEALAKARLTAESWRLEIGTADEAKAERKPTFDFPALLRLGEKRGVRFLKALQCNNLCLPLGQGLWEGAPLADLLDECGALANVRRVRYWGFHNDDLKQRFAASLALNQALEAAPGELPPIVAYKLNGAPIPLERGGPVRMIVPWAHGFKCIKWLQRIELTNDYKADDTYALENNDPESRLKTAAYVEQGAAPKFAKGMPIVLRGVAIAGWSGLARVEVISLPAAPEPPPADDAAWNKGTMFIATIDPPPGDWRSEIKGADPKAWFGFDGAGRPKEWPMRFCIAHWTATATGLPPGKHVYRVRAVDANGRIQPSPRPNEQSGDNGVMTGNFETG
jgi:DMSO/TMAO reductase YedYZ molybdopterin-dependent catalytic subunit